VIPGSMTHSGCVMESFLWAYTVKGDPGDTLWVTVPPDSMQWGCGVSGPHLYLSVEDTRKDMRPALIVRGNYPNPFNPTTNVRFDLLARQHVKVHIYDVRGRLVRTLLDEVCDPGGHEIEWDGRNRGGRPAASGIYFFRVEARGFADTKKMVLVR